MATTSAVADVAAKSGASVGASRARVVSMVEELERHVLTSNLRGVRSTAEALRLELVDKSQVTALEGGALQALTGALSYARKDPAVTETVLNAAVALGKRPFLANGTSAPIALLLRNDGVATICRAATEHPVHVKIRALALKIVQNCCLDELGARIVTHAGGIAFLVDTLKRFGTDRMLAITALSALSNCCLYHLSARVALLATDSDGAAINALCAISRSFKQDADVLEYALCVLCLISTGKTGSKALLSIGTSSVGSDQTSASSSASCSSEVGSIAIDAVAAFAVRSYQKSVEDTQQASTGNGSMDIGANAFNAFKNGIQKLTTIAPASITSSLDMPSPIVPVVTSHERRCTAWSLMLLHNLALETTNMSLRREILLSLEREENPRDLHKMIVDRLRAVGLHSSENIQEEEVLEPTSFVDIIACQGEDLQDGSVLTVLLNVFFPFQVFLPPGTKNSKKDTIGSISSSPLEVFQHIFLSLQHELSSVKPLPISPAGTRLITFVFAFLSHPYTREKLNPQTFDFVASQIVGLLRSANPPEYFFGVAKAMELSIGNRDPKLPWIPHRSFPLMLPLPAVSAVNPNPSPLASLSAGNTPIKARSTPASSPAASMLNSAVGVIAAQTPSRGGEVLPVDSSAEFSLFEWRFAGKELCRQITLKMDQLYNSVNPCMLGFASRASHASHESNGDVPAVAEKSSMETPDGGEQRQQDENNAVIMGGLSDEDSPKFLRFHSALVRYFKREILSRADAEDRAALIECLIEIASYAATGTLSNLDLTMVCLEVLESESIKRLEICWRKVRSTSLLVFEELKELSRFDDLLQPWNKGPPPPLLRNPSIPYLFGCLDACAKLELNGMSKREAIATRYMCLNWWLPRLNRNGDWHPRPHMFTPIPSVQMALSQILSQAQSENLSGPTFQETGAKEGSPNKTDGLTFFTSPGSTLPQRVQEEEEDFTQFSTALEPSWALEQANMEDSIAVQAEIERILSGETGPVSIEATSLVTFRRSSVEVQTTENCGKLCKAIVIGLLQRPEHKFARKRREAYIRFCVERIVLGPTIARLFLTSIESVRDRESKLLVVIDQLRGFGIDRTCELLQVPTVHRLQWRGAVAVINSLTSAADLIPSYVLGLILRLKDEIFLEAKEKGLRELTADDLLPILSLIISQSTVKSLCASCHFLRAFYGDDLASGESAYYFVTIESAIQHLLITL